MPPIPTSTIDREKNGSEKHVLPTHAEQPPSKKPLNRLRASLCLAVGLLCIGVVFNGGVPQICYHSQSPVDTALDAYAESQLCPQEPSVTPSTQPNADLWSALVPLDNGTYASHKFLDKAVNWLAGAIQVKTESFDGMKSVGEDPRWEAFGPFHDYLLSAFPLVHTTLKRTKVNTYGLVYVWEGSDASLKPLLLTGHQDVVPVNAETVSEWKYAPYSGHFDGKRLWGRGSCDDKNGIIGILTTIETFLEHSFSPRRTVVLAFGFDEEASGVYGASSIGRYLLKTYGKNAFAMLVDEGGDYMNEYGSPLATVGTAEKGAFNLRIEVASPGGHSSVPPPHTSIGILSALLARIEEHPSVPHLSRGTPMYQKALCLAAHAHSLPSSTRRFLAKAARDDDDTALRHAEDALFDPSADTKGQWRALSGTTQAIDLVAGGVKANALPESAWAVVDHRIATDSSVQAIATHDMEVLRPVAEKFNLTYTAFGKVVSPGDGYGKLNIREAWGTELPPAPVTPTAGEKAGPFRLLAGTIRATYDVQRNVTSENGEGVVVSPGIMSGNTDTRHYWDLTEHIFRYNHQWTGDDRLLDNGPHTVNESIDVNAYLEMIRFFTTLILNVDESSL